MGLQTKHPDIRHPEPVGQVQDFGAAVSNLSWKQFWFTSYAS
jgi:hypothetical protein